MFNRSLYVFLQRFGEVSVSSEGSPLRWWVEKKIDKDLGLINEVKYGDGYEHYFTYCPLCNYHQPTLWVGYMFLQLMNVGTAEEPIMHHFLNQVCCYHCEEEQKSVVNPVVQLYTGGRVISPESSTVSRMVELFSSYMEWVTHKSVGRRVSAKVVQTATSGHEGDSVFIPPPPTTPVNQLPADHPCVAYLTSGDVARGARKTPVDLDLLAALGVGYCERFPFYEDPSDKMAIAQSRAYRRLVIPFFQDGRIVNWQARTVLPDDDRKRWIFPPGMGTHLYNFDLARLFQGVIITEGMFDAITAGMSGVAICRSNINDERARMMATHWSYHIIALDPKEFQMVVTDRNGRERQGKAHVIRRKLIEAGAANEPVLMSYAGYADDPSDLGPQLFRRLIKESVPATYWEAVNTRKEVA